MHASLSPAASHTWHAVAEASKAHAPVVAAIQAVGKALQALRHVHKAQPEAPPLHLHLIEQYLAVWAIPIPRTVTPGVSEGQGICR